MSIRAYIRKDFRMTDNEGVQWYRKEYEFCYNTGLQQNITQLLLEFGASDYRNEDGYGAIEISKYRFMRLFHNGLLQRLSGEDRNSLITIKNYFDTDYYRSKMLGYVRLECL